MYLYARRHFLCHRRDSMPCRHGQLHRLLLWKWWSLAAAFDQRGLLGDMAALENIAVSTRGTSRGNGVDAMCRPSVAWGSVSKQDCVACEAENCAVLRTPLSSANAPSLKALFLLVWMKAMVKVVCNLLVCDVGVSQHPDPTSVFETLLRTGVRNPDFTEEKSGVRPLLPGPSPTVSRPVDRCPCAGPWTRLQPHGLHRLRLRGVAGHTGRDGETKSSNTESRSGKTDSPVARSISYTPI
jgi:hypothetical protein